MNEKNEVPPLLGNIAACGFPSPSEQYVESPLDLNQLLVKNPAATYFVRVSGDSMTGAGIHSGDILVVDRSLDAADGDIVIACLDNEFTVKYFRRDCRGIRLEPANRNYPVIILEGEQELRLFGVVTSCIKQFKKNGTKK